MEHTQEQFDLPPKVSRKAHKVLKLFAQLGHGLPFSGVAKKLGGQRASWSFPIQELDAAGLIDRRGHHSYQLAHVTVEGYRLAGMAMKPYTHGRERKKKRSVGISLEGRTRFPKAVQDPEVGTPVLQPGYANKKLGSRITKGPYKGKRLWSITLEEGETCPKCDHEDICYGGNMHMARRWRAGPVLENAIRAQVQIIAPTAFMRWHVLGDFYSMTYTRMWFEELQVPGFGFTHRQPGTRLGDYLHNLDWSKYSVRHSWRAGVSDPVKTRGAVTVKDFSEAEKYDAIPCPVQTGSADSCANCGLCWNTERNIAFIEH